VHRVLNMTPRLRGRRGLTLAELLVALFLIGIIGMVFTRLLVAQGRFFSGQYSQRAARGVARAPMNLMLSELRMVQDRGGLAAAEADGKRVRLKVPYRFGVVCAATVDAAVASVLPVDSSLSTTYAGWAWRALDGSYTELVAADPLGADSVRDVTELGGEATCGALGIHKVVVSTAGGTTRQGRVVELRPPAAAPIISPVYLWQYVAYEFKASSAYPGSIGLFRIEADGTAGPKETELMAPFDTSARFRFFVPDVDTSLVEVPATLATVRGLELVLNGAAPTAAFGSSSRAVNRLTTAVFFKNVRAF
jgi:prepilin-type N-terminal cleavage/methylation domain-containing protein